jgi:hypothetical protein
MSSSGPAVSTLPVPTPRLLENTDYWDTVQATTVMAALPHSPEKKIVVRQSNRIWTNVRIGNLTIGLFGAADLGRGQ